MVLTRFVSYMDSVLGSREPGSDDLALLIELVEQMRAFSAALWEGEVTAELRTDLYSAATRNASPHDSH